MNNFNLSFPILTVEETRQCEQHTICSEPISSLDLMERAGIACADEISPNLLIDDFSSAFVFCGTGNNGGDGLVIARHLHHQWKGPITVVLCQTESPRHSTEMQTNLERWNAIVNTCEETRTVLFSKDIASELDANSLIIDAIFGIGLSRPATGVYAEAIQLINASDAYVYAIDTPSGLYADKHTPHDSAVVMANETLTIQYKKLSFLLPEAYPFCGYVTQLNIDMLPPEGLSWNRELLTTENVHPILKPMNPYGHKGSFGHGLLIAGCSDMPGATILASTAAMRGGIGKLTVHTAGSVVNLLPIALPEAILSRDHNADHVSEIRWNQLPSSINAIAIGPGLGNARCTVNVIKDVLDTIQAPIILDADALNMLAENKTWLAYLPANSILTPHFKEFERLAGPSSNGFERVEKAREFAKRYNVILILKGHHTIISMPDGHQFFNTTGNAGMGTAGSGDTLTGLLLALLAQGYTPAETALLGVHLHGLAGDIYVRDNAKQSLIASDLPKHFGKAFEEIRTYNDLYNLQCKL